MKTIAFFNNKGGVGKTSLVYHLAWMYADLGLNVVAADLDPQANLTSMFLEDERLEALWADGGHRQTIYGAFQPLLEGTGDVAAPHVEDVSPGLSLVAGGQMRPAGYVVLQHAVRLDRPVQAYGRWMARIPGEYRCSVLDETDSGTPAINTDPACIATLKHYRSLMPLAREAHKPIFFLKPADGAISGHMAAVQDGYRDFRDLAKRIARRCKIARP